MTIFLILAPFAAFALLMLVSSAAVSLFTGAAIAAAIIGYEVSRGRSIKMLAVGAVIMFSSLGCYITLIDGDWSATEVRLAVDIGTLAIALASIALRFPFTLQYAREAVDAETLKMPGFLRANYIISWAWTGAFVLMLIANLLTIYIPSLPFWVGLAIGVAARNSAVYFTKWYPAYRRAKYPVPTAGVLPAA
jgi:multisubunit Na+/H+ antiporter MnhG subunit